MAKLFNRAKMTTSTTGSGTVTLGSASVGYQSFADAGVSNGDVVQYVIEEGGNFEIGTGTYSSTGTSLTRSPTESSNSDAAINLGGAATVSITAVADDLNRLQHAGSDKVTVSSTGASVTGNLAVTGTVDGRDVAADGTKLDGIEANADVTDTANVTAAGALMDSEVTNLAQVKAFDSSDYATAAQGTTADAALPKAGGTMTGALNLGDSVKAQFGASNDLAIYHDSLNSYIVDQGTGNLNITSNGAAVYINKGTSEIMASFVTDGAVTLYHNNSAKIATASTGVDVTGNITVSGTVDGRDISGITATNTELNVLDGITATTAELNIMDGVTATTTELNYVDGVSSNIQTQLDTITANDWVTNARIATNAVNADSIAADAVGASEIAANAVGASELNVSGNGTTSQFLRSDGDGTFTWATPTDTNTTYSAGAGLDLSSTTFSVETDLRGDVTTIGPSTSDYFYVGSTAIDFYLDGNLDMRLENDGDLHVDGNVVAYSTTTSDPRLKENIQPVTNGLDKIMQLNGYTFDYKADGVSSAGVLSTEIKDVLPSAVKQSKLSLKLGNDNETEYDVVQYDQLTALFIEAIKDLKSEIDELKAKLGDK